MMAVLVVLAMIAGCGETPDSTATQQSFGHTDLPGTIAGRAHVIVVRGCTYVVVENSAGIAIVHAGDCPNASGHWMSRPK